jgi:ribosomal protein S18 acetylase RimI-like enzyme
MLITFEWSDWRNGVFWWIQSVYVSPEHRHQEVYTRILRQVMDEAKALGNVCGFRLYVDKENTRAQRVYEHLGLRKTNYEMYEVDFVLSR